MNLASRSAIILFTESFRVATTLAMGMILSRWLTKTDNGTFNQALILVYPLFSTVLSLSLPQSLYYFLPKSPDLDRPRVMTQTISMTLLMAAVTGLVMFAGAGLIGRWMNNADLPVMLRILSLYPLMDMVSQLVCPALISIERMGSSAFFGVTFSLVRIGSVVVPVWLGFPLVRVFEFLVLGACFTAGMGLVILVFRLKVRRFEWSGQLAREQIKYCIPLAGALAVGLLGRQMDKWIVGLFFPPDQWVIFSNGAMELPLVGILTGGLISAILPEMVRSAESKRLMEAFGLWKRTSRVTALAIFPTFVLSLMFAPELMMVLFGAGYVESSYPFVVYLFVLPIRIVYFNALLRALSVTPPIMVGALLSLGINAVVGFGLAALAGKSMLGFLSPAAASVLSQYLAAWYLLHAIRKVSGVGISDALPWGALLKLMAFSVLAGIPVLPIVYLPWPAITKLLAAAVVYLAGYGIILYWSGWLSEDERRLLSRVVHFKRSESHE